MASPRSRRSALVGALAVATVVVILIASGGVVSGLRSIGRGVVSPFAWALNEVAHPIADLFGGAVNYSSVVAQNHQLREELALRSRSANEETALTQQLQSITAMLHLTFVRNLDTVVAQVTANSPTNFAATVTISKGRLDGVLVGMPVVAAGGLLGRVIATTSNSATVQLISDQSSIVATTYGSGASSILVYGRGVNAALSASSIPLPSPPAPGTILTTSGLLGGDYPKGLPVASIGSVSLTPGSSEYNMTLNALADLSHLSYVDVVLWEPSS